MIINKEDIDRLLNTLIGERLIFIGTTAQDCGAADGFKKFTESLKEVVKDFCADRMRHKQTMPEKVEVINELCILLEGFCRTFRVGLTLNLLTSTKIVKPNLEIVKNVSLSKLN